MEGGKNNVSSRTGEEQQQTSRPKIMVRSVVSGLLEVSTKKPPITIWYYIDFHSTVPGTTSTVPGFL